MSFDFISSLRPWPLLAALALVAPAGAELADVTLEAVATGLEAPVAVAQNGDGRLYVVQLRGRVVIVDGGEILPEPFLNVTNRVPLAAQGIANLAFHPDYVTNGFAYAHLVDKDTADLLVVRYQVSADNPDRLKRSSEVVLIRHEKKLLRHFGGQLRFGPDGFLYVSTGDGSGRNDNDVLRIDPECASQAIDRWEGKLLRLDVDRNVFVPPYYAVPPDNPFPTSDRPEVWATGLRNPWRFSFDRETGDLWIGDVGEDEREEVNLEPAGSPGGRNYGWKVMEGTACFGDAGGCSAAPACNSAALALPVLEYTHAAGCSVTGGTVYRGSLVPDLYGRYLYGDFCTGTIWAARPAGDGTWLTEELPVALPTVVSFDEDAAGELFLSARGAVYRLEDPTLPAEGLVELAATRLDAAEDAGEIAVGVRRLGEAKGAVSVQARTRAGTATAGSDFTTASSTLFWDDGETGTKPFFVELLDDGEEESAETLTVELDPPAGGAILGARAVAEVAIADDDVPSCVADAEHLCLNQGRFRVSVDWRTDDDRTGRGRAEPQNVNAGSFWFFGPDNPEIFVKVLDACFDPFQHFWVFAAGLTDVEVSLQVVDTSTGARRTYESPQGEAFESVIDTQAFATCP